MSSVESVCFVAALATLGVAVVPSLVSLFTFRRASANPHPVKTRVSVSQAAALAIAGGALVLLTVSIVSRAVLTGHGPFSSLYEFSLAFAWGVIVVGVVTWWIYREPAIGAMAIAVALLLLIIASALPSRAAPLVPALQQSTLLTAHVAVAVTAYSTLAIGFCGALLLVVQRLRPSSRLPTFKTLDSLTYQAVAIGFPFLTLTIVLGALWADIAWGRYWSWDPKETASLVTWLLYASYLHARVMRGWKDVKAALILVFGFAAVLFTFLGSYIFGGLHAYG